MFKVVYLTGAPAAGKSTLSEYIAHKAGSVQLFTYSKELALQVGNRNSVAYDQEDMRRESARVVTPADVEQVDHQLVQFVSENRLRSHVIIDSHAVTKEHYGFRVTPFSQALLAKIAPDLIVCLFADSVTTIERIAFDARGRPLPTLHQADTHNNLQASVALTYSILSGRPVYFLDSTAPVAELEQWISNHLSKK